MAPSQIIIICPASNENQLYEKLCENDDFLEYRPDPSQKFCSLDEVKQYLPTCSPSAAARGGRPRLARFVADFSSATAAAQVSSSIGSEQFGADGTDRVVVVAVGGNNNTNNNRVAPAPVSSSTRRERSPDQHQQLQQQQQKQQQQVNVAPVLQQQQQQQQQQNPLFESVLGHHHQNNDNNHSSYQEQKFHNNMMQQQQQKPLHNNNIPLAWQQQSQFQFPQQQQQQQNFSNSNNINHHQQQPQQQQQQQESFKVFLGYQQTLQANPPTQQAVAECIKLNTGIVAKQVFVVGHKCAVFVHVNNKEEEDTLLAKGNLALAPHWKFMIKPAFAKKNEVNNNTNVVPAGFGVTATNNNVNSNIGNHQQQQQFNKNTNINNNNNNHFQNQVYASNTNIENIVNSNYATSTILFTSLPAGTTEELLFYRLLPHEPSLIRMIDGTNCAAVSFENSENAKAAMDFVQDKTLKGEKLTLRYV